MTDRTPEARHGRPAGSGRYVCVAALLAVVALSVIQTFVLPRPFYVWENDYDNGFYYNARALYYGLPIHNVQHPGTPVILLERLLMTAATARLGHMQSFLSELYLVVGLAYCASIGLFCLLVLRRFSTGVGALALSSLAAWPPFLMHLNYYCTDSFVLVVGLVATSAFWMLLESFPRPRLNQVIFAGTVCGLCLAIKLSFVPFVLALELASSVCLLRAAARPREKLLNLLALLSASFGAFAVAILPVFHRLDEIVLHTVGRRDVRVPKGVGHAIAQSSWALFRESPGFPALFLSVMLLAIVGVFWRRDRYVSDKAGLGRGATEFDDRAGLLFLVLMACSFVYGIACAAPVLRYSYSVGNSLRNASPSALVVPFGILYFARLRAKYRPANTKAPAWGSRALVGTALVVVVVSVSLHLVVRQRMIRDRVATVTKTEARLAELRRQYGSVAFWDKWMMGEASFDMWGNYAYAGSYFDDELLAKFKGYSWLDLRDIGRRSEHRREASSGSLSGIGTPIGGSGSTGEPFWRTAGHWMHERWLEMKAHRPAFPERAADLYAGQNRGLSVGLIAFAEDRAETEVYRPLGWTQSDLQARLESELGPLRLWKEQIGGIEWVFLARQDLGSGTAVARTGWPSR